METCGGGGLTNFATVEAVMCVLALIGETLGSGCQFLIPDEFLHVGCGWLGPRSTSGLTPSGHFTPEGIVHVHDQGSILPWDPNLQRGLALWTHALETH